MTDKAEPDELGSELDRIGNSDRRAGWLADRVYPHRPFTYLRTNVDPADDRGLDSRRVDEAAVAAIRMEAVSDLREAV